jgi:hypothetical protein
LRSADFGTASVAGERPALPGEVEGLPPEQLQDILDEAIRGVLDLEAFERECAAERADTHRLEDVRRTICEVLKTTNLKMGRGE